MKILILGAGGVGGYFGARLIEAGADVSFLVRPARQALIARHGLRIVSPHGDFVVQPVCVPASTLQPIYDLIVLTPKAYDLDDAIAAIAPAVGPNTWVLPFLNGVTHLQVLDQHFGRARVLGGVAHIAGELTAEGVIRQHTLLHKLLVGGRDAAAQAVARAFAGVCASARFDTVLVDDIDAVLWEKWAFLATLAGLTTLMRASVGEIMSSGHGETIVRRLYGECLAIAAQVGKPVHGAAQAAALGMLTDRKSALSASMRRDLDAGLRTEHAHVLGELLRLGEAHALDSPVLSTALTHLEIRAAAQRNDPIMNP